MAKKKNTILIVAGAGAAAFLAYKLLQPKQQTVLVQQPSGATATQPTGTASLISSSLSLLKSIFTPQQPAAPVIQDYAPTTDTSVQSASDVSPVLNTGLTIPQNVQAPAVLLPLSQDAAIAGLGTTAETGATILKITGTLSPILSEIPVVGWIGIGLGTVVGAALSIFGNKWHENVLTRWLVVQYEYYVLGINNNSETHIQEAHVNPAISWFTVVLGVPVWDIYDTDRLRGISGTDGHDLGYTDQQKAQDYLSHVKLSPLPAGSQTPTIDNALLAVNIIKNMPTFDPVTKKQMPLGSWANMTAAPSMFNNSGLQTAGVNSILPTSNQAGTTSLPGGIGISSNLLPAPVTPAQAAASSGGGISTPLLIGAAGVGALLLFSGKKKVSSVSGFDINKIQLEKYIVPVALVGGGYFLYKKLFGTTLDNAISTNNNTVSQTNASGVQASIDANAKNGGTTTITDAQAAGLANTIASIGLNGSIPLSQSDQDSVKWSIIQANTLGDLLLIIKNFGTRKFNTGGDWTACSWFALGCPSLDLPTFVKTYLNGSTIADINIYLADQSINYQF
jgi:hypothetical protein